MAAATQRQATIGVLFMVSSVPNVSRFCCAARPYTGAKRFNYLFGDSSNRLLERASELRDTTYAPYLDLCASSSISIINSGKASPLTSSQLPVGNCFV